MSGIELKSKTISGIKWSAIDRFTSSAVQFVIGIIIARLLQPSDYGLIGMLAIFIALSQTIIDGGFSQALMQKKDTNPQDYSTVFILNITISFFLYVILYITSPFIATFYNEPLLENLAKVTGLNFIINAFAIVQTALLSKKLDFKTQTKVSFISSICSGIIGILLAYYGFGVWALVAQTLSKNIINAILLWILSQWKPNFVFSKNSFLKLFGFGSKVMLSSILTVIFDNLYLLSIGKFYSAKELGFYTRANQFQQFPVSTITAILQRVFLPAFSHIQDEDERLINAYRKFIKFTAFVIFPVMFGLGAIAKPMVLIVLTEKWLPIVPMLQLMILYGAFYPIQALNLHILNVKGRSDLFLYIEIIKRILVIIALIITVPIGIYAMIIGFGIISFISFFINTYYTKKMFHYGAIQQLKDFFPSLLNAIIMTILVYFTVKYIDNSYISLSVGAIFGAIYYVSVAYFLKFGEFLEIKKIILKNGK